MEQLTNDDIGQIIYLGAFAVLIAGAYLAHSRLKFSQMLQQAAIWVFIFLGGIVAVGLWQDMGPKLMGRQSVDGAGVVSVPRAMDGHYYLTLDINEVPTRFVVDTGATDMVLSQKDAARVGIDTSALAYLGRANTANGEVRTALVRLGSVALGPITDRNVSAVVNQGQMDMSLLGMSYLEDFGEISISSGTLTLSR